MIVGAPYQSAEESLEDLLFLAARRVLAGISVYYPAPGSRDFDTCRTFNILPETFTLMRSSVLPISHTTTRKEAVTLLRLGRIINFMKFLQDLDAASNRAPKQPADTHKPDPRIENGKNLLRMFFDDGKIRGITPEGDIYEHNIKKLQRISVRGTY